MPTINEFSDAATVEVTAPPAISAGATGPAPLSSIALPRVDEPAADWVLNDWPTYDW